MGNPNMAEIGRAAAKNRKPRSPKKTPTGHAVEPRYLDTKQAAAYLAISPQSIRLLVKSGALPEVDIGPFSKRYALADLETFAQSRRRVAAELLG